jgi:3,4-dihydroxy 2-butanone 4-phosphate synthase/GTP cyclohydrolase II
MQLKLDPIEEVIEDVRAGRAVVIIDDKDRENEGDLMVAAELVTPQSIAFMMEHGKGLICLSLTQDRLQKLQLPLQVTENRTMFHTNFAVSFDHASVVPYGVSAEGRATTIRRAVDDNAAPEDFVRPGFMYPLQAVSGGVLRRDGQTEGSVDLSALAGLKPAGVICEVMDDNGLMLSDDNLAAYCHKHQLKVTSVEAIREYRLGRERTVRRVASCKVEDLRFAPCQAEVPIPGRLESFRAIVYVDDSTNEEHLAVVRGTPRDEALVTSLLLDVAIVGTNLHQPLERLSRKVRGS